MKKILTVKNLSFNYNGRAVLDGVSFDVGKGDYIALAGPNGAGKTTLIKLILGLEKAHSGDIKLYGTGIDQFSVWKKIGYLPQRVGNFNPIFPITAEEVVRLGLLAGKKYPKKFNDKDEKEVAHVFELLEIEKFKKRAVGMLSGGEQQKIFLARALVNNPDILILDEPTTALDPKGRENFFSLIEKLNTEKKMAIVMITHDVAQMGKIAQKLLYLDGKIIFYGLFRDFCGSEKMEKHFGHFAQHVICHQHA